jgi:hypothetical protein
LGMFALSTKRTTSVVCANISLALGIDDGCAKYRLFNYCPGF